MAKKFGKILFATAAIGTAAAAAYYYFKKKDADLTASNIDDEDYDDFSEDLDDEADSSRTYVALNRENAQTTEDTTDKDSFTPLHETLSKAAEATEEKVEETVEDFFDEEDSTEADSTEADSTAQ